MVWGLFEGITFIALMIICVCSCSSALGFPCGSADKEPTSTGNARDLGLIPGLARSPGEGKGYLLQYSDLENSIYCIVYGVTKSPT